MHGWPGTPLEEPTALPRPPSSIKGLTSKGGKEGREGKGMEGGGEGNWYHPTFWEKVTPCNQQTDRQPTPHVLHRLHLVLCDRALNCL